MVLRSRGRRDVRPQAKGPRANEDIRVPQVRVIDEEGEQLGVLPIEEALEAADNRGLDLVEVSPNADPPVCKIMDYGRYKYTQQKKAHDARKRQKVVEVKEVKMRVKIDDHDYGFKKRHAERFLNDGNKAKVTIMFRGREITHPDLGRKLLDRLANELMEISNMEQHPKLEGRNMVMILAPKPGRPAPASRSKAPKEASTPDRGLKAPMAEALEKAGTSVDDSASDSSGAESPEAGGPESKSPESESGSESSSENKEGNEDAKA